MFEYQVVSDTGGRATCLSRHHTKAAAEERCRQLVEGMKKRYPYHRSGYRVSRIADEPLPAGYHLRAR